MGDLILGPVVNAAVSKVIAIASDQLNLALGWNEDLQKFRSTMRSLQGLLQDADEKNVSGNLALKSWLQDLRAIADEANDILEEVAYENMQRQMAVQKSKVRYFFTQSDPRALVFRQKMANKVKNLNKKLAAINLSANQLGLQYKLANTGPEPRARAGLETHSLLPSPVFGRKEDVSKIVSLLVDSSSQHDLPVMTIVGMPGLGKTTLAKAVLEDDKIREHFSDNKPWVCVSENFDVKKILMVVLKACGGSSSGDGDFGSKDILMKKIQEKLRKENYLLILDDVWNEERQMWEDLRDCLLGISAKKGSRWKVLVTTRLENVASLMALTDEHIHRPCLLKEEECWSIIKQRAFGDNSVPEAVEGIEIQIARRCKGVPLAARIIGGMPLNEWQAITENRVWDSPEKEKGILDIIKFSYDRLPTLALKQCFAFCSIFPKDFVMEREMLIQLWMAHGFLESSEKSYMAAEDIGDKYFKYLLSYSLFQEERRDNVTGSVESCKMHDLIHDFAQSISRPETLIVEEWPGSNISRDVRHLNVIGGREMVLLPTILGDVTKKLQTLFSEHGFSGGVQVDLKRLRVLNLNYASDAKQLPKCFGNSKSLRYLDISGTEIEELSKFITKLYNLQTFRFMDCRSLKMPEGGIGDLINLRHIYFDDEERMPANLGRLTNLQTLLLFFVGTTKGRKIEELGSLRGLKGRLEIRKLDLVEGKSEAEKAKLHEKAIDVLELCWSKEGNRDKLDEDVLEGLKPHSNIRILSIEGYGGRNLASWMSKSSEELMLLNNLVDLKISDCSMLYRISSISWFSSLQWLSVERCYKLTSLGDGDEAVLTSMSLKELSINWCNELERFLVNGLSSLEELNIAHCNVINSIGGSLSSSTCLKQLSLVECPELKFISSLDGLVSLKAIIIGDCDGLECLPTRLSSCTAMEELLIWSCSNLVSIPEELKQLQSLVELVVHNCPKLMSFPEEILDFVSLKRLELGPFSEELEEFPNLCSTSTSTSTPTPTPTSLEVLCLEGWGESLTLPCQIQCLTALRDLTIKSFNGVEEALLGNLSCLKTVTIRDCTRLRCLLGGLSSVEELVITQCPSLVSFQGELKELRSLEIVGCPKLVGFPEKSLDCCTRLKRLEIGPFSEELEEFPSLSSIHASLEELIMYGWEKLTHLPQIQHLAALKELRIYNFSGMESLPDWFNNLSSLLRLYIWSCPKKLKERCTKGSGPDWHKISHIPYIKIGREIIQSQH
ncbi:hypothetical protein SLA2020_436600 [Shorea laevis]